MYPAQNLTLNDTLINQTLLNQTLNDTLINHTLINQTLNHSLNSSRILNAKPLSTDDTLTLQAKNISNIYSQYMQNPANGHLDASGPTLTFSEEAPIQYEYVKDRLS